MLFDDAFITAMTAQDIANVIQSFYDEGSENYFNLVVTDSSEHTQELWVRPRLEQLPQTLARGDQIIPCEIENGQAAEIIIPARWRDMMPALVILARRAGSES